MRDVILPHGPCPASAGLSGERRHALEELKDILHRWDILRDGDLLVISIRSCRKGNAQDAWPYFHSTRYRRLHRITARSPPWIRRRESSIPHADRVSFSSPPMRFSRVPTPEERRRAMTLKILSGIVSMASTPIRSRPRYADGTSPVFRASARMKSQIYTIIIICSTAPGTIRSPITGNSRRLSAILPGDRVFRMKSGSRPASTTPRPHRASTASPLSERTLRLLEPGGRWPFTSPRPTQHRRPQRLRRQVLDMMPYSTSLHGRALQG